MKISKRFISLLFMVALSFFEIPLSAQTTTNSPEQTVEKLYKLVTFEAGDSPDWNAVKDLFLKDAVIVLRNTRTENTIYDLAGFVDEFKRFIEEDRVIESGFSETILKKQTMVFGDIASFLVLYEAKIPGTERKNLGVDQFSLIKKDGIWKIVSIINEVPTNDRPIPKVLSD